MSIMQNLLATLTQRIKNSQTSKLIREINFRMIKIQVSNFIRN